MPVPLPPISGGLDPAPYTPVADSDATSAHTPLGPSLMSVAAKIVNGVLGLQRLFRVHLLPLAAYALPLGPLWAGHAETLPPRAYACAVCSAWSTFHRIPAGSWLQISAQPDDFPKTT